MASSPQARRGITLEEFLRLPEIDEHPYLEYIDGRIEAKPLPKKAHSEIEVQLCNRFNQFATPRGLGRAFVELRCTFAGRSIVPDVVFLRDEHILVDERGRMVDETPFPPDLHVEILSPDQSVSDAHQKLIHSTGHGCEIGLLIHPDREAIDVYRPGRPPERLPDDGILDGEPVLPGFRLPVAEVFGWLIYRRPGIGPGAAPA